MTCEILKIDFVEEFYNREMHSVLEKIILILPLPTLINCLTVNKTWEEIVSFYNDSKNSRICHIVWWSKEQGMESEKTADRLRFEKVQHFPNRRSSHHRRWDRGCHCRSHQSFQGPFKKILFHFLDFFTILWLLLNYWIFVNKFCYTRQLCVFKNRVLKSEN